MLNSGKVALETSVIFSYLLFFEHTTFRDSATRKMNYLK